MGSTPEINIRQGMLFKSFFLNGGIFINDFKKQFAKAL